MTGSHTSGPGWYPDPSGFHQLRYYSGAMWTDQVSNAGVVTTVPLTQPTVASVAVAQPVAPATWPPAGYAAYPPYGVVGAGAAGWPAVNRVKTTGPVLVLVGGVLMALGTLFPWETVSVPSFYSGTLADVKGTSEGAGPVALVAGLVAALLAVLILIGTTGRRKTGIATLVISAASLPFVFGNYSAISKDIDGAPSGVIANIGIGLIFAVIGGILAAIASISVIWKRP
jgi:hypothetical protein